MGQIELTLDGLFEAFPVAEELGDAENGSERIVQLMGDAGEHLAHGSQLFRLNQLLFQTLEVGDVAAGKNNTVNLACFIKERAEIEANAAPLGMLIADAHFEGS